MNNINKLILYFFLVLLTFINLNVGGGDIRFVTKQTNQTADASFSIQKANLTNFTEQRVSTNSLKTGNNLPVTTKPVFWFSGGEASNSVVFSGSKYIYITRLVFFGLQPADMLFPFHHFW